MMTQIFKLHKSRSLKKLNFTSHFGDSFGERQNVRRYFRKHFIQSFWNDIATQFGCDIKQTFNQP